MKKLLISLLVIVLLAAALASCIGDTGVDPTTRPISGSDPVATDPGVSDDLNDTTAPLFSDVCYDSSTDVPADTTGSGPDGSTDDADGSFLTKADSFEEAVSGAGFDHFELPETTDDFGSHYKYSYAPGIARAYYSGSRGKMTVTKRLPDVMPDDDEGLQKQTIDHKGLEIDVFTLDDEIVLVSWDFGSYAYSISYQPYLPYGYESIGSAVELIEQIS